MAMASVVGRRRRVEGADQRQAGDVCQVFGEGGEEKTSGTSRLVPSSLYQSLVTRLAVGQDTQDAFCAPPCCRGRPAGCCVPACYDDTHIHTPNTRIEADQGPGSRAQSGPIRSAEQSETGSVSDVRRDGWWDGGLVRATMLLCDLSDSRNRAVNAAIGLMMPRCEREAQLEVLLGDDVERSRCDPFDHALVNPAMIRR